MKFNQPHLGHYFKPTCFTFLYSLFFYAHCAFALSWSEALEITKNNNSDLQSSEALVQSSVMTKKSVRSGYLPEISLSLSTGVTGYYQNNPANTQNYGFNFNVSQNLFAGFLTTEKMNYAEAQVTSAQLRLQIITARTAYELKTSYQNLLSASENLLLSKDILRRRQNNLHLVELRFQGGRENKGSVLLSKAYLQQAELELSQAENESQRAQVLLRKILGMSNDETLVITEPVPALEPTALRLALKDLVFNTPEYKLSQAEVDSARANQKLAQASFYPSLNLTGSTGQQRNDYFPNSAERWDVGLTLTVPIFNGGRDFYSEKSALSTTIAAEKQLVSQQRNLLNKLYESYDNWTESIQKQKVDFSFQQAALLRTEISTYKYNNGLLSFEDWDVIENDLITRQRSYLVSQKNRILAQAAWQQALGQGL